MDIDWRLAGNANPFASFAEGLQYGQGVKQDRQRQALYERRQAFDEDRARREDEAAAQQAERAEQARRLGEVKTVLQGLASSVPEGQRLPAFQKAAPMLARLGLDANELASATEDELSNSSLAMIGAKIDEATLQGVNLGQGGYGEYNPKGKTPEERFRVLREPDRPLILGNGATAFDNEGRVIARNPKSYAPARPGGVGAGLPPPPAGWRPR